MKIDRLIQHMISPQASATRTETPQSDARPISSDWIPSGQKQRVQALLDKHRFTPTKEQQRDIGAFLSAKDPKRMETLDITLFKGIEPTKDNLEVVHAGLHGSVEPVEAMIDEELSQAESERIAGKLELPSEIRQSVMEKLRGGQTLKQALKQVLTQVLTEHPGKHTKAEITEDLPTLVRLIRAATGSGGEAEGNVNGVTGHTTAPAPQDQPTKQAMQPMSTMPAPDALQQGNPELVEIALGAAIVSEGQVGFDLDRSRGVVSVTPDVAMRMPRTMGAEVKTNMPSPSTDALRSIRLSDFGGREEAIGGAVARETVVEGDLETAAEQEAELETEAVLATLQQLSDRLSQTMQAFDYRTYLVETQTELTQTARVEFEQFVKTFVQDLQNPNAEGIRNAIDTLSKAINKSSFSMLTDMKTEKSLLVASSELEKAQELLRGGAVREALRIVQQVKESVEAIDFKPSVRKIQLLTEHRALRTDRALREEQVSVRTHFEEGLHLFSAETARDILERVRLNGFNHEIEVYERTKPTIDLVNLKEILLRLEDAGTSESSMLSLTGQQMSNNSDDRGREFYSFDVPLIIDGEVEGMKV
ncbi:MAG: hypothetical protein Q4A52_06575, partial [Bacillota bacterium]|nr:hypothetical protein [Bacillota bacterium]